MTNLPERAGRTGRVAGRLTLGQLVALIGTAPLVILLASVVLGIMAVNHQSSVRADLLNHVEPADNAALELETAMVNQETGIRGFELTGQSSFLGPYNEGLVAERQYAVRLRDARIPGTRRALFIALARIATWQQLTAQPAIRRGRLIPDTSSLVVDANVAGKQQFDAIRAALTGLDAAISRRVRVARADLQASSRTTEVTLATIAAVLLATVLAAALVLRRLVNRPLGRLTASARMVAAGELDHSLLLDGPRDIAGLAKDMDVMRRRLVEQLDAATVARNELAVTAEDLTRSNAELEQFAYVASHDLQEPLRKVASFCQMLQTRYADQLDERANQYIDFAVDGAKRMQQLINDLLAFSRVGRVGNPKVVTDLTQLAEAAAADLQDVAQAVGAEVRIDPLPHLAVEASLMRTVFQNLIGNSIKFHGEDAPWVHLSASATDAGWEFSCADNGIGIDAEYAERVFVIFQRLHPRERYAGTGIGLALCRKIVEHHGGRIWLDTEYEGGSRVRFTLPVGSGTSGVTSATMATDAAA